MDSNKQQHIVFVVNPVSGTQDKESVLQAVHEGIDRQRYTFEIRETEYAGHATEIAAQCAADGVFAVVAVGGDGTVNETARSLVHTGTALGIIPCGSGNGLARHLQIGMSTRKAIDTINEGRVEDIDYGRINDHDFFVTCGVGFDAFVSLKFAQAGKRGPLTYIEQALKESLNYKPETYELTIDGNTEHYKAFLIACGNAAQYGNNAYIAPKATLTDGLLDVTVLQPFTPLDVPELALQLFTKTIDQNSHIKTLRCKSLHIARQTEGVVHYDGEPVMTGSDIAVSIVPAGLRVIAPNETRDPNMLERAQEVISGLRQVNEEFFDGIVQRNKEIIGKGKKQIKRIAKQ